MEWQGRRFEVVEAIDLYDGPGEIRFLYETITPGTWAVLFRDDDGVYYFDGNDFDEIKSIVLDRLRTSTPCW